MGNRVMNTARQPNQIIALIYSFHKKTKTPYNATQIMKNIFTLLALSLAVLTFSNCKTDCPPDEKTGSIQLDDATRAFNPYIGDERLFFKNEAATEEIALHSPDGLTTNTEHLCYEVICTEVKFGSPTSCKYYEAESQRINFVDDDHQLLFDLVFFSEVLRQNEPLFFDEVKLSLSTEDTNDAAATVSKIRFSEPYDSTELNIQEWLTFVPEVFEFSNVYVHEGEFLSFFFTKEQGLVGFTFQNEYWWLDRIER